jgi:hypothetical protein
VVQVVECLPSKCEALNSNPSTAKLKKKKCVGRGGIPLILVLRRLRQEDSKFEASLVYILNLM